MSYLYKQIGQKYTPWNSGSAEYFPGFKNENHHLTIGVECRLGNLMIKDIALFDTGADWTLIGGETAILLEDHFGESYESIAIHARGSRFEATLKRLPIHLLAIAGCGTDLHIDSTVAVAPDWYGPVVLGYHGFMERIRFAIEPQNYLDTQNRIYFDNLK